MPEDRRLLHHLAVWKFIVAIAVVTFITIGIEGTFAWVLPAITAWLINRGRANDEIDLWLPTLLWACFVCLLVVDQTGGLALI